MKSYRILAAILLSILFLTGTSHGQSISGLVLDYYGTSPVNGVTVQCLETTGADSTVYRFTTGTDGYFSIAVPPATYYVCVNGNAAGSRYTPMYYGGWNYASYSTTVTVESGQNVTDVYFYMYVGYKVQGQVTYGGQPAIASVIAYDNTTGLYYYGLTGTISGSDGLFSMTLPQGIYEFTAYVADNDQPAQLSPVVINDDRDATNLIQLEIPAVAAVSGTITGPGETPIEDVRVDAFDVENMYSYGNATTNENGDFTITDLPVGRQFRFLCRTDFHPYFTYWDFPGTWYPSTTDPDMASLLTIQAGGHTGIDIALDANGGTVSGNVTDIDGNPVENAYVFDFYYPGDTISPFVAITQRTLYTNENGVFTLTGIADNIGIAVIADGYVPQVYNNQNMTTVLDTGEMLTINPGDEITDINFSLTPSENLGSAPSITTIVPHFVVKGTSSHITITGTGFSTNADIDLMDFYPFYFTGTYPVVQVDSITSETITLTVTTSSSTATGAYYLAITNPDGQYISTGLVIMEPEAQPEFSILAGPETFNPNSTLTLSSNVCNMTAQPRAVDGYTGLLLPTGDAVFYDGTNFSMDLIPYFSADTLPAGQFQALTLEFELPLGGAILPAGEYLWFSGLFAPGTPGTWDVIDVSLKTIYTY